MAIQIKENTKAPYQLLPPLTDEEYQALKANITDHGILVPIEVDEAGIMLDGHHRVKAWCELRAEGIKVPDYPRLIRAGLTEAQKRNHVRALNLLRRHLTKGELKKQMKAMRQDGMAYQDIANTSGVSYGKAYVETKNEAVNINNDNQKSEIKTKRGQKRPAKYKPRTPKTVIATSKVQEEKAIESIAGAGEALPDKIVTTTRAARIAREFLASNPQTEEISPPHPNCDLRLGDFRQILPTIPPNSIDLIFTDPPYDSGHLDLWSELSRLASEVLRPGALLISYSGQTYLPTIMAALGEHLHYIWLGALIMPGPHVLIHDRHIWCTVKPILFYAKPPFAPNQWCKDSFIIEEPDKDHHKWEQSSEAALYFIQALTKPGAAILDPFLGTGTTAIATLRLGRHFTGCESDKGILTIARNKILEALKQ